MFYIKEYINGFIKGWRTYLNHGYGIKLRYPRNWRIKEGYYDRYEGEDGFFSLDVLGKGDNSIDETVENIIKSNKLPYGSNPTVENIIIDGQQGRLILPSMDQIDEKEREGFILVSYPYGLQVLSGFQYLILFGSSNYLKQIGESIEFLGG